MANRVLKWQSPPHHLLHALLRGKLLVVAGVFICTFAGTSLFLDYMSIYIESIPIFIMFFDISHSLLLSVIAHTSNCSQKHGQVLIGTSTQSLMNDLIAKTWFFLFLGGCFSSMFRPLFWTPHWLRSHSETGWAVVERLLKCSTEFPDFEERQVRLWLKMIWPTCNLMPTKNP